MQAEVLPNFRNCRIIVLGDAMLDRYIMGEVRRISPEAPVPVLHIKERYEVMGGAGNVGNNLAKIGCEAILIGIIGQDREGEILRDLCSQNEIGDMLVVDKSRPTITKTRVIAKEQQLIRVDEEELEILDGSVRDELLSQFEKNVAGCRAVILSDYGKGIFQMPDFCQSVISIARGHKVPVFVDPKGKQWERYSHATCITPNTSELESVAGTSIHSDLHLAQEAEKIRERYHAEWILVTRGSKGMCLLGQEETPLIIPTIAREVYDVSGAGDTVIATLAACIAAGVNFPEAARMANTAAGIVVGKLGTQPITAAELQDVLRLEESNGNGVRYAGKSGSLESAQMKVQAWRSNGDRIVFTNGCFDLLHPGHIHLLEEARAMGDRLIVGLNSDASVKRLKGSRRPILPERDRLVLLKALTCVDLVVIFEEDTPVKLIETLRPDILVKGSDYRFEEVVGREIVESYGGQVALVSLVGDYSTTRVVEKLAS